MKKFIKSTGEALYLSLFAVKMVILGFFLFTGNFTFFAIYFVLLIPTIYLLMAAYDRKNDHFKLFSK